MAEKIVSPGVFTKEIDASFLPAAIGEIGAAVVGPTIKGPAMVPTVVSSYAEFQATFGDTFSSGSNKYQFLTSVAAQNYLKNGLIIMPIVSLDFHQLCVRLLRILDKTLEKYRIFPTAAILIYSILTQKEAGNFVIKRDGFFPTP